MSKPFVIALLGAESTGKSQLAQNLAKALRTAGHTVQVVTEHLREWCAKNDRVPLPSEQAAIAQTQTDHIQAAADSGCAVVIADTTALMTAVYSDYLFADRTLYADALAAHQHCDLTLLMGLDVPWVADGLQRDGPHVREAVDSLIRQSLSDAGIAVTTIFGLHAARLDAALAVALRAMTPVQAVIKPSAWRHYCECCSDGECERQAVRLLQSR